MTDREAGGDDGARRAGGRAHHRPRSSGATVTDDGSATGSSGIADGTYYSDARVDLLEWLGAAGERVLDVGCGIGANAEWLRTHGATYIEGVEPHDSAKRAEAVFDRVHHATIEDARSSLGGPFDLIICADILEHLVDPWTAVRDLRTHLAPNGRLAVSIPNVRYLPALARIAFGPGFRPEASGTFDGSHLRFFTRRNVDDMLQLSGWRAARWGYASFSRVGTVRRVLGRLSFGLNDEWLVGQWFVEARPASSL